MTVFAKDPASTVDYSFDWTNWLTADEVLSATSWFITPNDAQAPDLGVEISAGNTRGIYISGGAAGQRYKLTCRATTSANRTAERSITIRVMEL